MAGTAYIGHKPALLSVDLLSGETGEAAWVAKGTDGTPIPWSSAPVLHLPGDVVVTPLVGADDEINGAVAPRQGSEFFEDVEGDYYDGLQNEHGEDRIALGSAVLRPRQTWGAGMMDTALAMLTAGIAASHMRIHRCELLR